MPKEDLEPKKISGRHRALMRRLVAGMPLGDAARELGYNQARASIIKNSPLFLEEMMKMQEDINSGFVDAESSKIHTDIVRRRFDELSKVAVNTLGEGLEDESGHVRITAAKEILDRSGYVKEEKLKADVFVEPTPALLNLLNRIVKEKESGDDISGEHTSSEEKGTK